MINEKDLFNTLVFDIETSTKTKDYSSLSSDFQKEWNHKCDVRYKDLLSAGWDYAKIYLERAPLNLDFTRIVCISLGVYKSDDNYVIKSVTGDTEKEILIKFADGLKQIKQTVLAGANIANYDIPLLCRAYLRNGLKIPLRLLNIINSKPWERDAILFDLCEKWSFGSYDNKYNRFNSICISLGIDSPKTDIDGTQVTRIFYEENDLDRIAAYCERDVKATLDCLVVIKNIYKD